MTSVGGETLLMLVDTGATHSTTRKATPNMLSDKSINLSGLTGKATPLRMTKELTLKLAGQTFKSSLIYSPQTPVNLLGRDILQATGAVINCSPDAMYLTWPNGYSIACTPARSHGLYVFREEHMAEGVSIYWLLLEPGTPEMTGLYAKMLEWKPWSPSDIGRCTKMDPVTLEVVPGSRVYVPQRPFRTDKQREGIETALTDLWEAGVLELSDSHWNTPLNPVPKPDGTFRPAHDLRKVNEVTTTPLLPVPDPHKCLSVLTPEMKYFTVIDLKHAFFTIPLAEECRYQFAFTYGGVKLQYKVLPQGHRNSPGIFNKVLKDCLSPIKVLSGAVILQYVDDVLIGARSAKDCLDVTAAVLSRLLECGFKVSKTKLQCCRSQVVFLGKVISAGHITPSATQRQSILVADRPDTVRSLLSFLGLANYSRHHVMDYTGKTAPLRDIIRAAGVRDLQASLSWTEEADKALQI
uniref:ribonuclease H n=1 Tax=Neogobius melanostomus TaxID=47308 RepID=A0A8C6U8M0_9GOBI